jgi:deoxyribonuclease V
MILALDVQYVDNIGFVSGILFSHWQDPSPQQIIHHKEENIHGYIPGEFYKRELPCLLGLIHKLDLSIIDTLIIDGFVLLNNEGKPGLGMYLYNALNNSIPVIGVAKSDFYNNELNTVKVYRGQSQSPLYVGSVGIDKEMAAEYIKQMHGEFRIPTLLKMVDSLARQAASSE